MKRNQELQLEAHHKRMKQMRNHANRWLLCIVCMLWIWWFMICNVVCGARFIMGCSQTCRSISSLIILFSEFPAGAEFLIYAILTSTCFMLVTVGRRGWRRWELSTLSLRAKYKQSWCVVVVMCVRSCRGRSNLLTVQWRILNSLLYSVTVCSCH